MNGEQGIWRISDTAGTRQLVVDAYSRGRGKKWIWLRCIVCSTDALADPLSGVVTFHLHEEYDDHFRRAKIPVARGEAIYVVPTDGPFEVRAETGNVDLHVNLNELKGITWWRP